MKIGIEAERANNPVKTGVEHYAKQLILHLAELDRQNDYVLYLRTKPESWFLNLPKNFRVKIIPFPFFWTQLRLSFEMLLHPVDVLLVPASALPLIHPKRSIVTIHDLGWRYFPESFTWFMRNFLQWSTGFAAKQANKIVAISESTKNDLIRFYKIKPEKVEVVHLGYEVNRQQTADSKQIGIVLPEKYVLFLSTLQPRKNLEGLIEAFKQLKKENPELPHKLVVVGKSGWKFESILKKIEYNKSIVNYLNYVSDEDRFAILKRADLLVVPSFYEGFGMQILESFASGIPVAASNVSSIPEVAKDAALYFNPHSVSEIKNSLKSVLLDRSLADSLRQKGKERLKDFSWEKCARETLKVIEQN